MAKIENANITVKLNFTTGLSWSTIFKMAIMRWLCWELYDRYLRVWEDAKRSARKAITSAVILVAVLVPQYAFMNRAECAAFPATAERYPWLTFETYEIGRAHV